MDGTQQLLYLLAVCALGRLRVVRPVDAVVEDAQILSHLEHRTLLQLLLGVLGAYIRSAQQQLYLVGEPRRLAR